MKRGYGFLSGFLPFSFTETVRGCMSLKIYKTQGKAVKVIVNNKEEKLLGLLAGFRPRIRPLDSANKPHLHDNLFVGTV
jgi:hypothetical protein